MSEYSQVSSISSATTLATPSIILAVVENALPTKLILTFGVANTFLIPTDFTVTGKTVSSISRDVTNKILTLTLSSPVIKDAVMTITLRGNITSITNNVL